MHSDAAITLEVRRDDWKTTRITQTQLPETLNDGEVLLAVDRFALTANNVSYASSGDALGYWRFFPAEDGWGRIPAMGWADVAASAHPAIEVGERVWGFFPFSTHLVISAGNVKPGQFSDISEHRKGLAPVYAQFDRASANPIYEAAREDQDSLLRGLFMTSWLVEDFLQVNEQFGAEQCLITSASSKTSIALAHCVKRRGELKTVALTSARNVVFCQELGCYDEVHTYDQIDTLDPNTTSVMVDMAGNANVITSVHTHFRERLTHSCRIGATHHDSMGSTDGLPGAKPEFFFAPHHVQSRSAELGAAELMGRLGAAYVGFREFCDGWLKVHRSVGPAAADAVYAEVVAGTSDPSLGHIVSMSGDRAG